MAALAAAACAALLCCPEQAQHELGRAEPAGAPAEPREPAAPIAPAPAAVPVAADGDSRTVPELLHAGKLRMIARDHAGAIELFERVIAREPQNADGYSHRGSARASLGQIEGALDDYGRALILLPEDDPRAVRIRHFVDQIAGSSGKE
jgi:tetratricopeptide (TPR) repeat protein